MEFTSDKYFLEVVNMKDGMYTLTRNYDIAHVIVGEVSYNGIVHGAKKNFANLLAGTSIDFTVPSIILLGYAK
jgi:hypothetical protein